MRRAVDIIDVNRVWGVWVGSRRYGYRIGTVRAADRLTALRIARSNHPNIRIGFVEEDDA
ncbi:hypothetical protein EIK56_17940 [Sphingomonas sp. C8-2]|nr:hypothetical protein EIK56_17940 [Sphingomonas sp. C8-2]